MSDAPGDAGPFTVYVVVEDLQHNGSITYDSDRDGTPDGSLSSVGLAAFQVDVAYDPAILSVDSVEAGPDLERTGRSFQCLPPLRQPGSFSFGCVSSGATPPGAQGTLTLASLTLVPQGNGLSPLSLDASIVGPLGDPAPLVVSGGAVRVTGLVTKATTAPGSSATPPASGTTSTAARPTVGSTTPGPTASQTAASPATATVIPDRPTSAGPGGDPPPDSGGDSFGGAMLWSAVVVAGSVGVGGVLALAAMIWRQRQHRSLT